MKIKERISAFKEIPLLRTKLITSLTMIYNFLWSIGKILVGAFTLSYAYIMSGCYTLLLGFSKRIFVTNHGRDEKYAKGEWVKVNKETKSMIMGVLILISGVAYGIYMGSLFFYRRAQSFSLIWSIFLAVCSFVEIIIAVCNLFRVRKKDDILLSSLRCCNFVSALYAIVLTQVALLSATGTENTSILNGTTGIIAGIVAILIGVFIIVRARKRNKEKQSQPQEIAVETALDTIEEENEIMATSTKQNELENRQTTPTKYDAELKD